MLAIKINSLTHYAKGIMLQSKRLLHMLVSKKFQVLFNTFDIDSISPFFHNTCILSVL